MKEKIKKKMRLISGVLIVVGSELGLYASFTTPPKNWLDWLLIAYFLAMPILALVTEIRRCEKWNFQN